MRNQIIKETKNVRQMHQRKLIKTIEEFEMMKNGLINVFNIPIADQTEMMHYRDYRRRCV